MQAALLYSRSAESNQHEARVWSSERRWSSFLDVSTAQLSLDPIPTAWRTQKKTMPNISMGL
jgi:hypothetical protein